jgi:protein gp37
MADKSKIEWCDATWNVAYGCSKVSAGCKNCYAHRMISTRFPHLTGCKTKLDIYGEELEIESTIGWDNRAHFKPERLEIPFHWKKPRRIFPCSMSDLFHESLTDDQIAAVFGVMAATPQHQYVVLTKRLQRAVEWFTLGLESPETTLPIECLNMMAKIVNSTERIRYKIPKWPLENVIMCASVENQPAVDERVSLLFQIPARWRGVSVEPMLERIDLRHIDAEIKSPLSGLFWINALTGKHTDMGRPCQTIRPLDLVVCGAETGPGKRPFKDEWALDLRDQCKAAGTPFFFKKDGSGKPTLCGVEYHEWPED